MTVLPPGANPDSKHPLLEFPQICFIKNTVKNPNIMIGNYTYYDDPEDSENFERNVLYHFPFVGDRLMIGKFCALARGIKFIMNGANHRISGFLSYPFEIFGNGWEAVAPGVDELPYKTVYVKRQNPAGCRRFRGLFRHLKEQN